MTALAEKIVDEALSLPREERAALVERLLESLNVTPDLEIDRLWAVEAERRTMELDKKQRRPCPASKRSARYANVWANVWANELGLLHRDAP